MSKQTKQVNQIKPNTAGVAIGMNANRVTNSSARLYMLGKNQGKAAVIWGSTNRKYSSGDEQEYAATARKVEVDSDVEVEEIFFVKNVLNDKEPNLWGTYQVVVKDLETGYYDVIEMPKFNAQNMDLGFEYHYDNDLMRKLVKGARFSRGTIFATSARISESNEWCPGVQTMVAAMSHAYTEEDAVVIFDHYAKKIGVTFKRSFDHQWNEDEYVPLNLYSDDPDNPQMCPLSGQRVRDDGIVMGFRRKDADAAMASMTKKALMTPDPIYDTLFYAAPGCIVADILVETERYKNLSNNKRAEKRSQPHTRILERLEEEQNAFANSIVKWYRDKQRQYLDKRPPLTKALWNLIMFQGQGAITRDFTTPSSNGKFTKIKRKMGNIQLKDWRVQIFLKEDVEGKVRFKNTGMDGNKSVIMKILPSSMAPVDDHGNMADMIVGNTPGFRRQIYSSFIELDVNFINIHLYPKIVEAYEKKEYDKAFKIARDFYDTVSPEQAAMLDELDEKGRMSHLHWIMKDENEFAALGNNTNDLQGVKIVERLVDNYPEIQPTPVTYMNEFGEQIRTRHPIVISSVYYIMLDKFGDDISCQSTPKLNIFGLPTSLSKHERARDFYRATLNRNVGETEGRLYINQKGGAAAVRILALANSAELLEESVKRLIRADNPFTIERLVYPGEEKNNHSLQVIDSMLSDFGLVLRKESEEDKTPGIC
ncbi:RNA polymerase beta subunit [Pseudomonas phage OBP]|uniref:RNA polymerase beta subunit n=1 Tax=Pseudomonas phage OBP TaxID=1124849 RepID=UPI000240D427|nr:RNA polymerase beta subunit [Pseudomonas phage OBP]AEV89510.1 RNA polymerase beta subunit [Pseudomonas phage OBP]